MAAAGDEAKEGQGFGFTLTLPGGSVSFSEAEGRLFSALFTLVDRSETDTIGGAEGACFLARSRLEKPVLREIWRLACGGQSKSTLAREEFYVAMKLVSLAQATDRCTMAPIYDGELLPLPDFHLADPVDEHAFVEGGWAGGWARVVGPGHARTRS